MKSAEYTFDRVVGGYAGTAHVYRGSEGDYILVSRADTFDRGDETMIFSWDNDTDHVPDWNDLYSGYGEDHATAVKNYVAERD